MLGILIFILIWAMALTYLVLRKIREDEKKKEPVDQEPKIPDEKPIEEPESTEAEQEEVPDSTEEEQEEVPESTEEEEATPEE